MSKSLSSSVASEKNTSAFQNQHYVKEISTNLTVLYSHHVSNSTDGKNLGHARGRWLKLILYFCTNNYPLPLLFTCSEPQKLITHLRFYGVVNIYYIDKFLYYIWSGPVWQLPSIFPLGVKKKQKAISRVTNKRKAISRTIIG